MKRCEKCNRELPEDTPDSVYGCTAGVGCADYANSECRFCEFEEGWGKPFCGVCGKVFDTVPILTRIKNYVAGVNADYKEDEERDSCVAAIDLLIRNHSEP
jgi:hypothetical protein